MRRSTAAAATALALGMALGTALADGAAAGASPLPPPVPLAELPRLSEPAGVGRLVLPVRPAYPLPLVVMVPDALGDDGRSEPYAETLASRGAAVLVLGLGEDADATGPGAETEPAASPEAVAVALAWAERDRRFDAGRTGLVGLGLGGRAVLAARGGRPAVALYPGCRGLVLPDAGGSVLVLHGSGAPDAADCARLASAAAPGVAVRALHGAGHAWDAPGEHGTTAGPLLPDPAGGRRRIRAAPDLHATFAAAEAICDFLLGHGATSGPVREAAR